MNFNVYKIIIILHILFQSNTDQDKPYWRGDIWININYLTVRALHHYGNQEGPYKEKAMELYTQLRYMIMFLVIR